jgi:hypothetical protein
MVAASLAFAAMKFATLGWAIATASVTVLLLLFSVVLAAYRRPFWVGFAICGIGYLMLAEMPFMSALRSFLITSQSVWFLLERLHPVTDYQFNRDAYNLLAERFQVITDCFSALILASVGGLLAQFAAAKAPDRS